MEKEAISLYVKGFLEYLGDYEWDKAIVQWNMSANIGFFKIYNKEGNEIRPQYFRDENNLEQPKKSVPESMKVADETIKKLYERSFQNKSSKWNLLLLQIYSNSKFNYEFKWDYQVYKKHQIALSKANFSILYDRFYEIISFELLPEINWKIAEVESKIVDKAVIHNIYTIGKNFDVELPEKWTDYLLALHSKTNEQDVFFGPWNKMVLQMRNVEDFNFEKDVVLSLE